MCAYERCHQPAGGALGLCPEHEAQAHRVLAHGHTVKIPCTDCGKMLAFFQCSSGRCNRCRMRVNERERTLAAGKTCTECGVLLHYGNVSGRCRAHANPKAVAA